ncbi:hypothetical protein [Methylocystis heyeri]|uniref:Right handed beta helix domain-containing protein n=1 Tax=Methylocystis heyeri TaxID=391905 RepID=A0A6B8KJG5_9HYPH|nr:hypothetical protein [Methylocystis heyeri]QGM46728.1 hypothetical protein H2LOC_014070 [Methylocystis heyeri]
MSKLWIGSNTHLHVDPAMTIRQAPGSNGNLISTKAANRAWQSATITWTSGLTATLTQTAHGYSVGSPVVVDGQTDVTDSAYSCVCIVQSVIDANNVVISLRRTPAAAATGTIQGKLADQNVWIEGGLWDFDQANNAGAPVGVNKVSLVMFGVHRLKVENVSVTNSAKYALFLLSVADVEVRGLDVVNMPSDALKIQGPATNFTVDRVSIRSNGDDGVTVQPIQPYAYPGWNLNRGGDILNGHVRNVSSTKYVLTGMVAGIYAQPNFVVDNIVFDGISGEAGNIVSYQNGGANTSGGPTASTIGSTEIANVETDGTHVAVSLIANLPTGLTIENLLLRNINDANTASISVGPINVGPNTTVKKLNVLGGSFKNPPAANQYIYLSGALESLTVDGLYIAGANASILQSASGASLSNMTISRCRLNGISRLAYLVAGSTGNPLFVVTGNYGSAAQGLAISESADAYFEGNSFSGISLGLVRAYKSGADIPNVSVRSGGGNILSGGSIWLTLVTGTEVMSLYGMDIRADASIITRADGEYFYNTNPALGTLGVAGLIFGQGTATGSRHLMSNPSLAY